VAGKQKRSIFLLSIFLPPPPSPRGQISLRLNRCADAQTLKELGFSLGTLFDEGDASKEKLQKAITESHFLLLKVNFESYL
jgi:hypothetical protein